ncbi:hypothetical protein FOZ62_026196 [Perkinsus olseni]|uniref:Uncharacterized protein n=1 Tax=Perkinsus olseni TaxID=32597 RepID=A0A7J6SWX6_PEROL|nr:hypothetical protein FOZ62_026196 [Perkinsus olseni]
MTGLTDTPTSPASPTSSDQLLRDILQEELPILPSEGEIGQTASPLESQEKEGQGIQSGSTYGYPGGPPGTSSDLHGVPSMISSPASTPGGRRAPRRSRRSLEPLVPSFVQPPSSEPPLRSSSTSILRRDDGTAASDSSITLELHNQLALTRSRCQELEHAEKIQSADISSLRASNMALRAEVNSAQRQVAMSDEEVRSLRKRLDSTSRSLADLKAATAALEAQNSVLLRSRSEDVERTLQEDRMTSTSDRPVAAMQSGVQTDPLDDQESRQLRIIDDLKRKLVDHQERESKLEIFWPGIDFLNRHAAAVSDGEGSGDGGELWLKVLAHLDGRIRELEEENRTFRNREDRVRRLQRTAACKVDGTTVKTLNELQQQLRIKSDLIESLVKRQANTSFVDAELNRGDQKSLRALLLQPVTDEDADSDSSIPRLIEFASMLTYERDRRRQLEALLEEQIAATGCATAECDSLKASEACLLADFRSLASQVSLLVRQLHTVTVAHHGGEKGRRTRTEAEGAKALQSLQRQLSRIVQRVDARGSNTLGSRGSFPSSESGLSLLGSRSTSARASYAVSRRVTSLSVGGSREGDLDLSVAQRTSLKAASFASPARPKRATVGGALNRRSWSSASEMFRAL